MAYHAQRILRATPSPWDITQDRARACGARRRRVLVAAHRRVAACSSLGLGLGVAGAMESHTYGVDGHLAPLLDFKGQF